LLCLNFENFFVLIPMYQIQIRNKTMFNCALSFFTNLNKQKKHLYHFPDDSYEDRFE
jgi:hypothetical protein